MVTGWLVFVATLRLTYRRIGLLLVVNLLWWLCALPVVTWPPATAGLHHVARRLTQPDEDEQTTWRHFFEGFKQYWRAGWQVAALNLIVLLVLAVNIYFYLSLLAPGLRLISLPFIYLLLLWAGMQLYLFPLLIEQQDKRIRLIFKNAFLLTTQNMGFTLALGLLLISMILVASTLTGPVLLILISFLAVAKVLATQYVLRKGSS
jgi:uncharacterized membrane protein YesL